MLMRRRSIEEKLVAKNERKTDQAHEESWEPEKPVTKEWEFHEDHHAALAEATERAEVEASQSKRMSPKKSPNKRRSMQTQPEKLATAGLWPVWKESCTTCAKDCCTIS